MNFLLEGKRIASGRTVPGKTNWQVYDPNGIDLDVDTSAGRLTGTPIYITSIGGDGRHWSTTGDTSIYNPTATSFRVYVRNSDGNPLTPAQANNWKWHINWIGVEV